METPSWCTVLVHQYGRRKSTKRSGVHFSIKVPSFHLRTSIRAHKKYLIILGMVILLKIKGRYFFSTRQDSYFGVTHCDNWEVQIAVFSK